MMAVARLVEVDGWVSKDEEAFALNTCKKLLYSDSAAGLNLQHNSTSSDISAWGNTANLYPKIGLHNAEYHHRIVLLLLLLLLLS